MKILDACCGSGIFLVVEREQHLCTAWDEAAALEAEGAEFSKVKALLDHRVASILGIPAAVRLVVSEFFDVRFLLNDGKYHPDTPEEYNHYCCGDQEPISPGGQLGNDRLRLDITIIRCGIRPRLSFILEAKRLRTGGFPIGKYVGDGGMGDFIECRYGAEHPEAAMTR